MRQPWLLFVFSMVIVSSALGQRRPRIISQNPVNTNEEQAVTIEFNDLVVDDWRYPQGYTLTVYEGNNYTFSEHTVTPSLNFTGTLTVPVTVNNGNRTSTVFNFRITVSPVNDPPVITAQAALQVQEDASITIQLANLTVTDPDNTYPTGFSMSLQGGSNYTVNGNIITPAANFNGSLTVNTTVSDGALSSNTFALKITVAPVNDPPVITGQTALSTKKNAPLAIQLSHLTVTDIDNTYPNGFSVALLAGSNYSISGTTITPAQNFVGLLTVSVNVRDGAANSASFPLKINVTDELEITGQVKLEINEDSVFLLKLADLVVNDPDRVYPNGFTLQILPGETYTAENLQITPKPDYSGNMLIGVTVANATKTSKPFNLTVNVKPVNDAPVILLEKETLPYVITGDPIPISGTLEITDPDDTSLILAEIGFQPETYRNGDDQLIFTNTSRINGMYNAAKGTLSLVGNASLSEYRDAIRSIQYQYTNVNDPVLEPKILYLLLNDGKSVSALYERLIELKEEVAFDIPNAFTPDNNAANDTWKVKPLKPSDRYGNAVVRVYDKRGSLVFESRGLENAWDGKLNGEFLPADTYYYTIDLNLASINTLYKGAVMILR
ncbi:MAG TPA: tandem-95 repeat protein [Ohtaekwangia sp.]